MYNAEQREIRPSARRFDAGSCAAVRRGTTPTRRDACGDGDERRQRQVRAQGARGATTATVAAAVAAAAVVGVVGVGQRAMP